jgi:tetratricopeptide (TPR) repeat protein
MERNAIAGEEDLYRQISLAIKYSSPGSFIFIEANLPTDREGFPERIKTKGIENPVYYININVDFPSNLPLHQTIAEWLREKIRENFLPVLFMDGFDRLFQDREKAKKWLETFNFSRESLSSINAILVFLAPTFCMDLFRRYAPDLWAWRAFFFTIPQEEGLIQTREMIQSLDMGTSFSPQDNPEKRNARINILIKLLEEELKRHGSIEAVWNNILYPLSQELFVSGRYDESYDILKKAEKWIDSNPETKEAVEYFDQSGKINYLKGDINTALNYFKQALKIDEKVFGKDHPNVATDVNNIAVVLQDKGELEAALQYLQKALEIDEKVLGKNHPKVASDVNNIAMVLKDKGDTEAALQYLHQALEIDEKALGKDHPNVATDVNHIALVLKDKGDTEAALQYLHRALEIDEKVFGKDHPKVAIRVNNIAMILQDKGDIKASLQYLQRALEIDEKVLGRDHPNVAIHVNNIAMVLKDKGDIEGAQRNLKRAYKIFLKSYGMEHPSTKTVLGNYISCGGNPEEL